MSNHERLRCIKCDCLMRLDDIDFCFTGKQDNYWICDECHCGAVEKIRYNKRFAVDWDFNE